MKLCRLCKFETDVDDFVCSMKNDTVICLRCYNKEVGIHPMSKPLQRLMEATLIQLGVYVG